MSFYMAALARAKIQDTARLNGEKPVTRYEMLEILESYNALWAANWAARWGMKRATDAE